MLKLKNSNTLATWCEELTHLKRPRWWKRLKAGREGDERGWDGWMASQTQWTWVWANSMSWWWTGRPDVLQSMGSQRAKYISVTEQPQIGSIKWFVSWEASHLWLERAPLNCWKGKVCKGKEGAKKETISNECIALGKLTLLSGKEGVYQQIS